MKQITSFILLILSIISCQNSKKEENQIKVLQEAAIKQFMKNNSILEDMKEVISRSANIVNDEKYLSDIKSILQKRSQCIEIDYDSVIVKSKDKLNNYQKYLLKDESNRKFPILDNESNLDLWYQILMVSETEYNVMSNYAAKIGIKEIRCYFGTPLIYYFFAPESIETQKNSYLIFKRVDKEFPEVKKYSISKIRIFRNEAKINLPFEMTKVDDVTIFRFTPELKGKYTIKAFQKCEEKYEWSVKWDKDITFDFEVH